jgi:IS30 family transposase
MKTVKVLTVREAAKRLDKRPETVQRMLLRRELTEAAVNDRTAVMDDVAFRRAVKAAARAAA